MVLPTATLTYQQDLQHAPQGYGWAAVISYGRLEGHDTHVCAFGCNLLPTGSWAAPKRPLRAPPYGSAGGTAQNQRVLRWSRLARLPHNIGGSYSI